MEKMNDVPARYKDSVLRLLRASMSENTRRTYAAVLRGFFAWCGENGFQPFPAEVGTVLAYLGDLLEQDRGLSSAYSFVAAVKKLHVLSGLTSPTDAASVKEAVQGFAKLAPKRRPVAASTLEDVKKMILAIDAAPRYGEARKKRDKALIILAFAGGFRREELVRLRMSDISWRRDSGGEEVLLLRVQHSKTDTPGGDPQVKVFFRASDSRFDPILLLKDWLGVLHEADEDGDDAPIFRGITRKKREAGGMKPGAMDATTFRQVVKRAAKLAGLKSISPHSLRAGFVTEALRQGRSERSVMNQTGHKSATRMREYYRRLDVTEDNAERGLI